MKKTIIRILTILSVHILYSVQAYAQVHDVKLDKIYDGVLTGYLAIYTAIDDGRETSIDRKKFASHFFMKIRGSDSIENNSGMVFVRP